jgi:hypothetical protein
MKDDAAQLRSVQERSLERMRERSSSRSKHGPPKRIPELIPGGVSQAFLSRNSSLRSTM